MYNGSICTVPVLNIVKRNNCCNNPFVCRKLSIVRVCFPVTGSPILFIYPRPWLMSAYPRASNLTPPPRLPKPLHLKGTVLESDPRGLSQVAALPRPRLK